MCQAVRVLFYAVVQVNIFHGRVLMCCISWWMQAMVLAVSSWPLSAETRVQYYANPREIYVTKSDCDNFLSKYFDFLPSVSIR